MRTCQNCFHKWSWLQTVRCGFTVFHWMTCPYCGEEQYLTKKASRKTFLSTMPIFFVFPVLSIFDLSIYLSFGIFFVMALIILGISPLFVELSNEPEKLWFEKK